MFKTSVIDAAIVRYKPILVIEKWILANIGASRLKRSLTSNWSRGLEMHLSLSDKHFMLYNKGTIILNLSKTKY